MLCKPFLHTLLTSCQRKSHKKSHKMVRITTLKTTQCFFRHPLKISASEKLKKQYLSKAQKEAHLKPPGSF